MLNPFRDKRQGIYRSAEGGKEPTATAVVYYPTSELRIFMVYRREQDQEGRRQYRGCRLTKCKHKLEPTRQYTAPGMLESSKCCMKSLSARYALGRCALPRNQLHLRPLVPTVSGVPCVELATPIEVIRTPVRRAFLERKGSALFSTTAR